MDQRLGVRTVAFSNPPVILESAATGSKKESEGKLAADFDLLVPDPLWEEKSWETAESKFLKHAISIAVEKAGIEWSKIGCIVSGDLMNQCTSTAFAIKDFHRPLLGVYGACSTMAESMIVAANFISSGWVEYAVAATSSHFCSAEKQFRTPLEYGGQRTPTAQWTVTGSGAAVLSAIGTGPKITHATLGKIVDRGVTDANNMGAAMAPAFVDTMVNHFKDTGRSVLDYDLIVSGDLGFVGRELAVRLAAENGLDFSVNYDDCGCMIFDRVKQDVHAGASGCACAGTVFCGHLMKRIRRGELKRILFAPTGALMSPTTCMQGESILGISYAVSIEQ
ncbi:MAG: stage V sporulation protein AD [Ruminococcaceae bacterium]|nr:stage V sporulation protein AD [Oscillospiraceae bacterium]